MFLPAGPMTGGLYRQPAHHLPDCHVGASGTALGPSSQGQQGTHCHCEPFRPTRRPILRLAVAEGEAIRARKQETMIFLEKEARKTGMSTG